MGSVLGCLDPVQKHWFCDSCVHCAYVLFSCLGSTSPGVCCEGDSSALHHDQRLQNPSPSGTPQHSAEAERSVAGCPEDGAINISRALCTSPMRWVDHSAHLHSVCWIFKEYSADQPCGEPSTPRFADVGSQQLRASVIQEVTVGDLESIFWTFKGLPMPLK